MKADRARAQTFGVIDSAGHGVCGSFERGTGRLAHGPYTSREAALRFIAEHIERYERTGEYGSSNPVGWRVVASEEVNR